MVVGRETGFATSSKLDSLSLSETSSLSANFDAPAASDCLLSFIVGGGPREAMGAGADEEGPLDGAAAGAGVGFGGAG